MAKQSFFVTGTDTGVGKTLVSAAILHAARAMGKHTLAMKPIASGCDRTPEGLRNEDALILQNAITEPLAYELINPVALEPAIAPHVAAEQAGRHITSDRLVGFCRGLQIRPADLLLVEGAGGSTTAIAGALSMSLTWVTLNTVTSATEAARAPPSASCQRCRRIGTTLSTGAEGCRPLSCSIC